ncbi:MAG: acetyl-CoA carboxylase carboxyltransferase subunit alpha [Alphaproteobacteria bacterium]|nr:acetyl-CoA carboxylase carboxyltransferase subunit alpha [Alphaproteobacteria bacterium]MBN2779651.1 acetyl-CoA carboxylase carboxyltransferase subunit alpha [Alphaproteobacteria bacterium]
MQLLPFEKDLNAKDIEKKYQNLTAWETVQVARHPNRPHFVDYLKHLFTDYQPLQGDRCFGDDNTILGGLARFNGQPVVVMGQEKGHDAQSRVKHNFGMPNPEGYRKAIRLMGLAEKFGLPVLSFVDTPGAFPGIEAEARGQAEAIARGIDAGLGLKTPFITTLIGEGGSGGAIGIATANKILMLQNAYYSVISPEGCSSILFKESGKAAEAAEALKLTAESLLQNGIIDEIIAELVGGAHRNLVETMDNVRSVLQKNLKELSELSAEECKQHRWDKFEKMTRI